MFQLDRESALAYLSMIDRELYRLDARYSDSASDVINKDIVSTLSGYTTRGYNVVGEIPTIPETLPTGLTRCMYVNLRVVRNYSLAQRGENVLRPLQSRTRVRCGGRNVFRITSRNVVVFFSLVLRQFIFLFFFNFLLRI